MELSSIYTLSLFLFLSLFHNLSHCQQAYVNNKQNDCYNLYPTTQGYLCNGPQKSCKSFVAFRSNPPYDSPLTIAYLLGSEASNIAAINNISVSDNIPTGKLVIVPTSCSCSGDFYQHKIPYTISSVDNSVSKTYFTIANYTYQGLTTCQALMNQNVDSGRNLKVGSQLMIPMRCACPSTNQTVNGITSLLTYVVTWDDSVPSIGEIYGVSEQSILEANQLTPTSIIFPFTPLLVPLKSERVGIGIGFLFLVFLAYHYLKKRKYTIRKQKLFKQNGGLLLQERFSSYGRGEKAKIFTAEELQRATDNYNQNRFLGQGGYGTVYKGVLPDGRAVAVKRSKAIDKNRIEQFINEVVILSQINHRNVVNLLGCCLETEVPLLVYEFISNGTLSYHIHQKDHESSLSWEDRLRIASEVAGALAYMHSAASIPIYHRDIKSSNILLDDKYGAKVSDFGTSRSVSVDETHLTTTVQGTFGYLDPEYFQSSQFTEKSDVYSFGVVLVELLTGEKPISFARAEEEINLVEHFISSTKENRVFQILDLRVAREAGSEEILTVAKLATECLKFNGKRGLR
ncbi:hypothetical protein L1049_020359 [Liquidambar formosana]|uniref:Uncharacterized protein n=1 Tax=Liquidambar formosana TaxID=63359 RepID=A0AAP0S8F9_LIQFO